MTVLTPANAFPNLAFPQHGGQAPTGTWSGPTTNLTHRWQMDSGTISGGVVLDQVGSLNATLHGSPTTQPTAPGAFALTCLGFQLGNVPGANSGQYLSLASSPLTLASAWSVGFWINFPDITYDDGTGGPRMVSWYDSANACQIAEVETSGGGPFDVNFNNGKELSSSAALVSNNTWVHLVFTWDGSSNAINYYRNGVGPTSLGSGGIGNGLAAGFTMMVRPDLVRYAKGLLYQLVTYSAVLNAAQVAQLYLADHEFSQVTSYVYPGAVRPKVTGPAVLSYTNAFPNLAFPQHLSGKTNTVQNFLYPGAVQPPAPATTASTFPVGYGVTIFRPRIVEGWRWRDSRKRPRILRSAGEKWQSSVK